MLHKDPLVEITSADEDRARAHDNFVRQARAKKLGKRVGAAAASNAPTVSDCADPSGVLLDVVGDTNGVWFSGEAPDEFERKECQRTPTEAILQHFARDYWLFS